MNIEGKVARGVSWLALFKFVSQFFSWLVTIIVARLLLPEDYGLMAMATIITGYAEIFSELGLGAAIIQRPNLNKTDLSSIFWFTMIVSLFFCLFSFAVAPITAHIFNEPRVLPLTQAVSVIFIISGLQIVPLNLLKKDLNFKTVGFIEMIGSMVACGSMLIMAYCGAGVWTLLGGRMINGVTRVLMLYYHALWRPSFHFRFKEAASYIRFGIVVSVSQSFYYLFEKSDKFFAGRAWSSQLVGYYSFAQQLALIPTEKIVSLINQVSFTAFSKLQDDKEAFNQLYLKIVEFTSTIVFPLYVGGFLVADELIVLLIGQQWLPAVFLFKFLCLAQIPRSINAINNFVHISRGEPNLGLFINVVLSISMAISFYFAVQFGLNAIVLPWLTTYSLICFGWIVFTVKKIEVNFFSYLTRLFHPAMATTIMLLAVIIIKKYLYGIETVLEYKVIVLVATVVIGGFVYIGYFMLFNRHIFSMIKNLKKA
jgi:O-antigen/teichoic acid export membrane protein